MAGNLKQNYNVQIPFNGRLEQGLVVLGISKDSGFYWDMFFAWYHNEPSDYVGWSMSDGFNGSSFNSVELENGFLKCNVTIPNKDHLYLRILSPSNFPGI